MEARLGAFLNKDCLLFCTGFGLLWSMTKGMMNTDVFAYPDLEFGFDPVFLVYLSLSSLTALVIALWAFARSKTLQINPWLLSAFFALGITILASQDHLWLKLLGCAICAVALSILLLERIGAFAVKRPGNLIIDIPLSFAMGNIFAWVYTAVGNEVSYYLYVMVPFISSALYSSLPKTANNEDPVSLDGVTLVMILKERFSRYRFLLALFLEFFSISLISIAVSYLFLAQGSIPGPRQVFIHLLAPTLGALITFFVRNILKSKINLLSFALMPIMATMLFALPLLGNGYVLLMKGLLMALVEYLIIMSLYLAMERAGAYHHDTVVLAATLLSLLGLSTLLGILSGRLFSFAGSDDGSLLWIMGMFSLYLLFMAFLVLPPRWRKGGDGARGAATPLALTPDEKVLRLISERFRLSAREQDVLGYLAAGRSSKYIASGLVLSEETVKGHIKRIYHKMDIHSKQELLDIVQESLLASATGREEKIPLEKG
jgi:DNA-binding CsgD family transcriptional regulator